MHQYIRARVHYGWKNWGRIRKKSFALFIYFFKDRLRRVGEIKLDCELFTKFSQEQEYEAVEW